MLNVTFYNCYAECLYAECLYAECCYAECRGAIITERFRRRQYLKNKKIKKFLISKKKVFKATSFIFGPRQSLEGHSQHFLRISYDQT
jgi:hypothetical protein